MSKKPKKKIKKQAPKKKAPAPVAKKAGKLAVDFIDPNKKNVLHIGCGPRNNPHLHKTFQSAEWNEVRLDIAEDTDPDIIADMCDMQCVGDNLFDAVWSSHNLEHVHAYQVPIALKEFFRVLKKGGFAFITLPDIKKVAEIIYKQGLEHVIYKSPIGPITPLDIMYGHSGAIGDGHLNMAHRTAFTTRTLAMKLASVGFGDISASSDGLNIWTRATKVDVPAGQKPRIHIVEEDVNEMMQRRDELDVPPQIMPVLGKHGL